jgi:DNA-3-methyladenine glycosylase II
MYVRELPPEDIQVSGLLMDNMARRRSSRVGKSDPIAAPVAPSPNRWAAAVRHLRRVDPHLRAIIDRIGPCRLEPRPDRFGTLVRAIIGQQISSKAAASIHSRLVEIGGQPHRPERLIELGEDALRGVGLSGVKARYVLNLAEAVASGAAPLNAIDDSWDDARITEVLIAIKGIGVWTAEMFLIFALNRPDVLPTRDLGVRVGLRDRHGLAELPRPSECCALAEHWRPYRSIASWYLWREADTPR